MKRSQIISALENDSSTLTPSICTDDNTMDGISDDFIFNIESNDEIFSVCSSTDVANSDTSSLCGSQKSLTS